MIINKKIIVAILIIALGTIIWFYFSNSSTVENVSKNTFFFSCPDGVELKISYDRESDSASLFILGEEYRIYPVISASGARYANNDETVIFWEHQGEAMVEINGEMVYQGCSLEE